MKWSLTILGMYFLLVRTIESLRKPCVGRDFGHGSIVCVCNSSYCDSQPSVGKIPNGKYIHIVSSEDGHRFETTENRIGRNSHFLHDDVNTVILMVNRSIMYQNVIGFGGGFTDSAGINIASLSRSLQTTIIKTYYGKEGLEYNMGRVPIAGTDFSTHPYSYDEIVNDTSLKSFALVKEDTLYKIPFIKDALKLNPEVKLIASPWSAPSWMKTNGKLFGQGTLKKEYYQIWADYLIKFLDSYSSHNLTFWAITTQNEPFDGFIPGFSFNCMGWNATEHRDWIKNHLGPSIVFSNHSNVKLITLDDQRALLLPWVKTILGDPEAAKYISGVGLHWYLDEYFPAFVLDMAQREFPSYFMIGTEACVGSNPLEEAVVLGSWVRAERYARDIIEDFNHFVAGWVDWNLVLDRNGGPNWSENFVDAAIIIDSELDLAYKQPVYYALGHFSKYIPQNSKRIHHQSENLKGLEILTTQRPDGAVTVVILNRMSHTMQLIVNDGDGSDISVSIGRRSIHTVLYN